MIYEYNLKELNSLTKYPSIPTYHMLDPRNGGLLDETVAFTGNVIGTEKVDGTNARIIVPPDGNFLIGSREELLYAKGDLIGNPSLGIVENLKNVAAKLPADDMGALRVYYLELYGGRIGGQAKQYSTQGSVGWRLFDIASIDEPEDKLAWPRHLISEWRDGGGQDFADEMLLQLSVSMTSIELTPRLFEVPAGDLPTSIDDTYAMLGGRLPFTWVALDDSGKGAAEGIVLRTEDRSVIAKARFQDYERTIRRRKSA